jgi:2-iminobutanoate/2-iminopropanoate deaminase
MRDCPRSKRGTG